MAVFAYEAAWRELGDAARPRALGLGGAAADFLRFRGRRHRPSAAERRPLGADGRAALVQRGCDLRRARHCGIDGDAARARARGALPPGRRARARGDRGASLERGARPFAIALGRALGRARRGAASRVRQAAPVPDEGVCSVDREDARVDSSLLGLAWPFRAVDPSSPRMRATIEAVERELRLEDGGVLRHEDDDYAGGNPGSSRRCGSGSPSDSPATTPVTARRSSTRSRDRPRSACFRAGQPRRRARLGDLRRVTRC